MNGLEQSLKIDLKKESSRIIEFIQRVLKESGASGVVVGMSGGVDSALVAALCVKALGPKEVFGVMLPLGFTPGKDTEDALRQAKQLGIEHTLIPIDEITHSFFRELRADAGAPANRIAVSNIRARTRMIILYYFANQRSSLVAGTGDKSEDMIGFFTKYGDGGVDFLPICHLYKTQVREMARYLGVPEEIASKPSSPQLYPGHKATDEIPLSYEEMDPVLVGLIDKGMRPEAVATATSVSIDTINKIVKKIKTSDHKRKYPPMVTSW